MGRTRPGGTTGGSVSNTLTESPFAGTVINVKDHGAVGDGSTDDTEPSGTRSPPLGKATRSTSRRDVPHLRSAWSPRHGRCTSRSRTRPPSRSSPAERAVSGVRGQVGAPVEFHHLTLDLSKPKAIEPPTARRGRSAGDPGPGRRGTPPSTSWCPPAASAAVTARESGWRGGKPGRRDRVSSGTRSSRTVARAASRSAGSTAPASRLSRFERCRNGIQAASCRDVVISAVAATDNRRHGLVPVLHDWHVHHCVAKGNGGGEKRPGEASRLGHRGRRRPRGRDPQQRLHHHRQHL